MLLEDGLVEILVRRASNNVGAAAISSLLGDLVDNMIARAKQIQVPSKYF